ncbi:GAF domain-containing protein [bacterium]|nr:MAG: GAF domain-containing protein [bacterium]
MKADLPDNELERLEALYSYHILDTLPEDIFDNFTLIASTICQTPISIIGFIDQDRQWYKSAYGLDADITEISRDISFCSHALLENKIMVVPDTRLDERFFDSPMVNEGLQVKFYASVPLITKNKFAIGTICVADSVPRDLSEQQIKALEALASQVIAQVEQRTYNNELEKIKKQLEHESNRLNDLFIIDIQGNASVKLSDLLPEKSEDYQKFASLNLQLTPEGESFIRGGFADVSFGGADIDDEALLGRNRAKKGMARTNKR